MRYQEHKIAESMLFIGDLSSSYSIYIAFLKTMQTSLSRFIVYENITLLHHKPRSLYSPVDDRALPTSGANASALARRKDEMTKVVNFILKYLYKMVDILYHICGCSSNKMSGRKEYLGVYE
jgi:hypothetical protein